ncbi:MAG: metal-dependent hydrolase, partial [Dokdonella sp.]
MDSLTHLFLGGAIGAAIATPHRRRLAILLGAALNSVPDIDVPIEKLLSLNAVDDMTWHRGPSHSVFVLIVVGLLIAAAGRRWWPLWQEAPQRWFWMIMACLITHPVIDAFTVYGTQLFWPWPM